MPTKVRPNPTIPDHDVLRKIGGGAYGEVWLARGVTGALRAVKVVWREDFEDERGFEREFEGILKFEPISRDHPALVNILHVGRSTDGVSFYYYVMELGDDVHTGRDINPVEYEPRTLRGDHHQGLGNQWSTDECVDVGLRLAEALEHLHGQGLAHRDVKPSNVIFVAGRAKLADIGLVATRGQRTFVGTEGFVPPEGPGSAQADIYSLGKVLYEIATGMDRMNFPELPEEMPSGGDRKRWLELNRIICEVCEPRITKRKISTAAGLAEALRRIQAGKRRRRSKMSWVATAAMVLGLGGWMSWPSVKDSEWFKQWYPVLVEQKAEMGSFRIFSSPEGADVYDADGKLVGTTPTLTMKAKLGDELIFTLRKEGYKALEIHGMLKMASMLEPQPLSGVMQVFSPPIYGEPWIDHIGQSYQPDGDEHVSSGKVTKDVWTNKAKLVRVGKEDVDFVTASENGQPVEWVLTTKRGAEAFCNWLRNSGIREGYLTEEYDVKPLIETSFYPLELSQRAKERDLKPFRVAVRRIIYGQIYVTTDPPGAELYLNGQSVGLTQGELVIPYVKPGPLQLLLILEGYKPLMKNYQLAEGQTLEEHLTLQKNQGVVFGRPWENGMRMQWVPVGQDLMVSIWETRVKDYQRFVQETGHQSPRPPSFAQDEDHPVVNISRDDAMAFCDWLTEKERKAERISKSHIYRLPTDLEWSVFVGISYENPTSSPSSRDARKQKVFPWGAAWLDYEKVGNFADSSAALSPGVDVSRTIPEYEDGYAYTAPVGSFYPNEIGIYDLSGNVQEWVSDDYSKNEMTQLGVLRGGGWNTYQIENLYTGSRNAVPPMYSDSMYGFRVVLAKLPAKIE